MFIPPRKNKIILTKDGSMEDKINLLKMLNQRVEEKINHFDDMRQQNLRYCIIIFSGLMAVAVKTDQLILRYFIVVGNILLMILFLLQDKRLHRRATGLRGTMYRTLQSIAYLLNGGSDDITVYRYDKEAAKEVNQINLRMCLYCLLIIAGIFSLFFLIFDFFRLLCEFTLSF